MLLLHGAFRCIRYPDGMGHNEKSRMLQANAAQLRQVVMNLITNASEALGEGVGLISVSVEQVPLVLDSSAQHPSQHRWIRWKLAIRVAA